MAFNRHGKPCGTGRSEAVYRYRYSDIARLSGLSVKTLRNYQYQKKLDMGDLASVCRFLGRFLGGEI